MDEISRIGRVPITEQNTRAPAARRAITMWSNYVHNWQRRAMVRSQEPFSLDAYPERRDRFHCPRVKLPICMHPMVMARGAEMIRFMLLQACYRFMDEIAGTEENIVIDINTKILDRSYMSHLDSSYHQVLRSINIDEYFHSMTGSSYRDQLQARTEREPIEFRAPSMRGEMRRQSSRIEDSAVQELFEVSVLCLIENTVVKSLLDCTKDAGCHGAFMDFIRRMLQDEAFHGGFYRELLRTAYQCIDIDIHESVARIMPEFIRNSLHAYEGQRSYARTLLEYCGFSSQQTEIIVAETYPETGDGDHFSTLNVAAARTLQLLGRIPVYQRDDIKACFEQHGLAL